MLANAVASLVRETLNHPLLTVFISSKAELGVPASQRNYQKWTDLIIVPPCTFYVVDWYFCQN